MPDYRDGEWHQWIGGDCPVDQDEQVEAKLLSGEQVQADAAALDWWGFKEFSQSGVIAFRLTNIQAEPREFFIVPGPMSLAPIFDDRAAAEDFAARCGRTQGVPSLAVFHVRVVTDAEGGTQ